MDIHHGRRTAARGAIRGIVSGVLLSAAMIAGLLACSPSAGTDFAAAFEDYLRGRPDVVSFSVRGNNNAAATVDSQVHLRPDLDDAHLVASMTEIAGHDVGTTVHRHNLSVFFTAPNASGEQAQLSVYLRGGEKRAVDSASALTDRIRKVRAYALDVSGLTRLWAVTNQVRVDTDGDPFAAAESLAAYVRDDDTGVDRAAVTGPRTGAIANGHIAFEAGDAISDLVRMREVLGVLPAGVIPVRWLATSQLPYRQPHFELVLPRGTSTAVVRTLRDRGIAFWVPVQITVAA